MLPKGPPALGTKGQEIDTLTGRLLRVIPGTAYHFNSHDGLAVADPFVADAGSITESDASMGTLAHVISPRGNGPERSGGGGVHVTLAQMDDRDHRSASERPRT